MFKVAEARALAGLLLVGSLVSAAAAQEPPRETVEGDAKAWSEVRSAYENLTRLKSYRARHPGDPSMVEVVNPDRFHYILDAGFVAIEFISVGSDYAERSGTGGQRGSWRCFPGRGGLTHLDERLPPMLLLTMAKQPTVESVKISRLAEIVVERDKTQGYQYTVVLTGRPPISERLFVLTERGLPRRTEVLDAAGNVLRSLGPSVDYRDYDARINIALPRCGP